MESQKTCFVSGNGRLDFFLELKGPIESFWTETDIL